MATPRGTFALATALCSGVAVLSPTPAAGQTFDLVGFAPGASSSRVYDVSADGRVAVGRNAGGSSRGFTWTRADGRSDFTAPGLPTATGAEGVSGDGAVVVGGANGTPYQRQAYRYTPGGAFEYLGVQTPYESSYAVDANHDGSIIVGRSEAQGGAFAQAFRWTSTTGLVGLGFARPGHFASEARAISQDGTTIVGLSRGSGKYDAIYWREGVGMQSLPDLPGSELGGSEAYGVNFNGSIVVGYSGSPLVATMWRNGQPEALGYAPGFGRSYAFAVNDDGTVVVGQVSVPGDTAAVWTPARGMERLSDYLAFHGVTIPEGVYLRECTGVSADGMTFVGNTGQAGQGQVRQGFVATIPSVGITFHMLAGAMLLVPMRRRSS